ncbi:MAG: GGDEF domain-containing protein [Burkholderiales bacterium]|nr:GGDEF domain-containing protein [Burkholderiales bacterium]
MEVVIPDSSNVRRQLTRWLLGPDPKQQRYVLRTLLAIFGYAVGTVIVETARINGLAAQSRVWLYDLIAMTGSVVFYGIVRLGLARNQPDPALTLWQMVFASSFATLIYTLFDQIRGALIAIQLAVVVYGTFNLRQRALWGFAVYVLLSMGGTMFVLCHLMPDRFTPATEWVHFMVLVMLQPSVAVLGSQFGAMQNQLKKQRRELEAAVARIQELASRDVLTGLYNRRHAMALLDHLIKAQARAARPCALALVDLDHFKQINDRYGHSVGDEALKGFALQAQEVLRGSELIARWGGEEFLLVLHDTPPDGALVALARLRSALQAQPISSTQSALRLNFSAGVTSLSATESAAQTIQRADQALYQAKAQGRGRDVVCAEIMST